MLQLLVKHWQGLDGEATEPMIKELEEDREESQDPEIEFAIAGAVREYGGLEILLDMIKVSFLNYKRKLRFKLGYSYFLSLLCVHTLGRCYIT